MREVAAQQRGRGSARFVRRALTGLGSLSADRPADGPGLVTFDRHLVPAVQSDALPEHAVGGCCNPRPQQRAQRHRADGSRLVRTATPCMDAEGGEDQAGRDGDEDGQWHRPALPLPQSQTADHVGEVSGQRSPVRRP